MMQSHHTADLNLLLDTVAAAGRHDDSADQTLDVMLDRGCGDALNARSATPSIKHASVRDADPLGLDQVMSRLPVLNAGRDIEALTDALRIAIVTAPTISTPEWAAAAVRDVGMLAASLQRHGADPVAAVPEVEPALIAWGDLSGTIPRDTVVHYGWWNPVGGRERHFTADAGQESVLIDSVRQACRLLPAAGLSLDFARHTGITSRVALEALGAAVQALQHYTAVFETVHKGVSPEYFARELRPYFDPLTINGTSYCGPAAAFVPLYLVDEVLWGTAPEHERMHREAVDYGRDLWRIRRAQLITHFPLDELISRRLESEAATDAMTAAAQLLSLATRALLRFRGQHATLAKRAYLSQLTSYATGSGGFTPNALVPITTSNRDAATQLDQIRLSAGHTR